jgi:hypothetical protein
LSILLLFWDLWMFSLLQAIYPLYPRPSSFLDPLLSCLLIMTFLTWIYFEVIYQCCLVSTWFSFLFLISALLCGRNRRWAILLLLLLLFYCCI